MAIDSKDKLIAAGSANGLSTAFLKIASTVNRHLSMWSATSQFPGAGPAPAAATTCDATTPGALPVPALTAAGRLHLTALQVTQIGDTLASGAVDLLDRYAHAGLSIASTAVLPVPLTLPARVTDATGSIPFLEIMSGSTVAAGTVFTLSYTNSAGVAGRTATLAYSQTMSVGTTWPFSLQAGDVGVSSVQSMQSPGWSTAAAVVLARRILQLPMFSAASVLPRRNYVAMADLGPSPCLYLQAYTSAVVWLMGQYTVVEG